jgi:hypothetical protein
MKISPQIDMPFHQRLTVQDAILQGLLENYEEARRLHPDAKAILVDRTPLDVLAYTMSEVLRETVTPTLMKEMELHQKRCFASMNFNFVGGCLVSPGIPLVSDETKAPANIFYQRHIHATMLDAVTHPENNVNIHILGSGIVDLDSRVIDVSEHCESIIYDDNELSALGNVPGSGSTSHRLH